MTIALPPPERTIMSGSATASYGVFPAPALRGLHTASFSYPKSFLDYAYVARYFENTATPPQVHGYDGSDPAQEALIAAALAAHWTEVTGSWPPAARTLTAAQQLAAQALAALNAMDAPGDCTIRCFKAGVAFPADWQAYCTELRAIVNGTSTANALTEMPAYPAGT